MGSPDSPAEGYALDYRLDEPRAPTRNHNENLQLWPDSVRRRIIIITGLFAFLEPFASTIVAPSLELIAADLHIKSSVKQNVSLIHSTPA
jgi:hypothetical protein